MTAIDKLDAAIAELQSVTDISAMEGFGDLWNGHDFCHEQAAHDPAPIDDAIAEILNAVLSGRLSRAALATVDRDALVKMIREADPDVWTGNAQGIADALLAAGYRKADALLAERDALIHDIERAKESESALLADLEEARVRGAE